MAEITAELDLEISRFRNAVRDADRRMSRFARDAGSHGRGIGGGLANGMSAAFRSVGPMLAGAFALVGGAALGYKIGSEVVQGVQAAATQETLEVSFEVLTGGPEEAKRVLEELRELGSSTPLEFFDLAEAGKSLLAFGEDADVVPDTLRRIGDIASGVGAPIGDIAEIYGKARVQQTLFAEDINQLTGRGINVISAFANQLGVSESEVKKLGSQGQITFPMLEQAFRDLTSEGGQFNGMMERQSETLAGRLSTFRDNINELRLEFGEPIVDAFKPVLEDGIELVQGLKDEAAAVGASVASGVDLALAAFQVLADQNLGDLLKTSLVLAFKEGVNFLYKSLIATWTASARLFQASVDGGIALLQEAAKPEFWQGVGDALLSAGLRLQALILEAAAELVTAAGFVPGADDFAAGFREEAETLRDAADERASRANDLLAPARERADVILTQGLEDTLAGLSAGFNEARDAWDTSSEIERLAELGSDIVAQADRLRTDRIAKEVESQKESGENAATATASPAFAGFQAVGAIQSSLNLLTGGSPFAALAESTRAQATATRENAKHTERAADTLERIERKRAPEPRVEVIKDRGRPRFQAVHSF